MLTAGAWPGAPAAASHSAWRCRSWPPGSCARGPARSCSPGPDHGRPDPAAGHRPLPAQEPGSQYWGIDLIAPSGISIGPAETGQPRVVSYGPAVASPAAFGPGRLAVGGVSWIVLPSAAGIRDGNLSGLAGRISQAVASLQGNNSLYGAQVSSGLPQLLSGLATNLVVAKSLLVISALQLALLAAVALGLAARLLASHREEESRCSPRGERRGGSWPGRRWPKRCCSAARPRWPGCWPAPGWPRCWSRPPSRARASGSPGSPRSAWWVALAVLALAAAVACSGPPCGR